MVPSSIDFVGVPISQILWLTPFTIHLLLFLILTEGSSAWSVITNTTSEVELFIVYNDTCVPDAVNLLADHLHRHLACHTLRHVIDV